MICKQFIHVGMGDTGEGIIRHALHDHLGGRVHFVNSDAHLPLRRGRKFSDGPSFSFIRNPFDWYISFWIHECKTRRWRGQFRDWLIGREGIGACMQRDWNYITDPGVDYVGRFETLKEDFANILSELIPNIVTTAEVLGWFPEAYKMWGGRPWMEGIEQNMRKELFTPELVDLVYQQDQYIFKQWGYAYEDRYIF